MHFYLYLRGRLFLGMDRVSEFKSQTDIDTTTGVTQNYQNRTSFLIEDILYREKGDDLQNEQQETSRQGQPPSSFIKPSQQIKYDNDGKLYLHQNHLQQQQQQQQHHHHQQQQYVNKSLEKRHESLKGGYGYFQPSIIQQSGGVSGVSVNGNGQQNFQSADNGYIQVMGALGAYLNTPYKSITDPYFLTQGKIVKEKNLKKRKKKKQKQN